MQPNPMLPGESLRQFHQRIYALYSADLKAPALAMLRQELNGIALQQIREMVATDPENWIAPYHFWWGMSVRNLLRDKGFGEAYWPIWNLDDLYVALVEEAAGA